MNGGFIHGISLRLLLLFSVQVYMCISLSFYFSLTHLPIGGLVIDPSGGPLDLCARRVLAGSHTLTKVLSLTLDINQTWK